MCIRDRYNAECWPSKLEVFISLLVGNKLNLIVDTILLDYVSGFMIVHWLKLLIKKRRKFNLEVHTVFINYTNAFNNVREKKLWSIMARSITAVSYTHLDVYKRQTYTWFNECLQKIFQANDIDEGRILLLSVTFQRPFHSSPPTHISCSSRSVGTVRSLLSSVPVSYTHLDVYKRQVYGDKEFLNVTFTLWKGGTLARSYTFPDS